MHQEAKINPRSASEALQTLHILIQGVPQTPFLSLTTALWSTCEAAPGAAWLPGTVDPTDLSVPAADLKLKDRNNPVPTASQPAHNHESFSARPGAWCFLSLGLSLSHSQPLEKALISLFPEPSSFICPMSDNFNSFFVSIANKQHGCVSISSQNKSLLLFLRSHTCASRSH